MSALASAIGCEDAGVLSLLRAASGDGLVVYDGSDAPARLTDAGRLTAQQLINDAVSDAGALDTAYEADYIPLNERVKHLCAEWQSRRGTSRASRALTALQRLHFQALLVFRDMAAWYPRIAVYERRLTSAVERFASGDERYVTSPLVDSYHSAWFECHAELMLALNRRPDREGS